MKIHCTMAVRTLASQLRYVEEAHDALGLTYRQLAGNNAAAVTVAILEAWTSLGQPTGAATTP